MIVNAGRNVMGKNTIERIIYIDQLIRNERYPKKADIAEHYEVSHKTIERDIDYMRCRLSAPIEYDRFRGGYHYSEEGFFLPAIHMNQHEALALFVSHYLGNAWQGTPLAETADTIWQRFAGTFGDEIVVDTAAFSDAIFLLDRNVAMNTEFWLQIFSCIRSRKKVELTYHVPGYENPLVCHLHPYKLIHHRNAWYIIGHDEYRKDLRTYGLSRIKNAKELPEKFVIPENFDLSNYIDTQFGIFREGAWFTVELKATRKIADMLMEHLPNRDLVEEALPDEMVGIQFTTNQKQELLHVILQWGKQIKVVNPEWLQNDLAEIGEYYCNTYALKRNNSENI